ncbi:MAG: dipeptide/oligopeptide/nickel ABC transporter permease/ATP-binding protein [Actinomycetota bacterium]|nr:dipeptide/oligopeptide/nickel ABC transporter permease/ATP-binding protein [Actinomycetota bacterium]
MRQLLRSPTALAGLILVTAFVTLAVIGPIVWGPRASHINPADLLQGSSSKHLLGTDGLGRDIFARVLAATRMSLVLSFLATLVGGVLGIALGALPSILPRRAGRLVTAVIGGLVAFPGLLLALFTTVVIGVGARGAVIGIGVAIAPVLARLTHTLTSSVAGSDYVAAARVLRVSRWRILVRHILPNVAEVLILNLTLLMGSALLGLAGLSFLGLGVQPPSYDWGRMLTEGLQRIYVNPEVALGPAVAILLAGIGFNLLGESLARVAAREHRVPRMRGAAPALPESETPADPVGAREVVLDLRDLRVTFPGGSMPVRELSLLVRAGEVVGIVGESGSGKSLTALAIGSLVPYPGVVTATRHRIAGAEISTIPTIARRRLLGRSLAMVFQDPMASLNPALCVGSQLAEVSLVHDRMPRRRSWERAVDRLTKVHISDPARRARQRPHEFSGGMRQRAMIAMGLMGTPALLIADEPTTALDVTVQRQIVDLIGEVAGRTGAAAIFISHDIAVVSEVCHRVAVMYAGRVVEELAVEDLRDGALHPYTRMLVASLPDMTTDRTRPLATIAGLPPSTTEVTPGCSFAPRCPAATARCHTSRPRLETVSGGHGVACWHPERGPVREAQVAAGAQP